MSFAVAFSLMTMTMLVTSEVVDECVDQQQGQQDGTSDIEPLYMIVTTISSSFCEGRGEPFSR